jgi:enoyl-CoA hydratase
MSHNEGAKATSKEWTSLRAEFEAPVGRLVLNRPEKLNALDWRAYRPGDEFSQALDALEADREIKVIILKGAGRAFCVGGDFSGEHGGKDLAPADDMAWMEGLSAQSLRLWRSPKPTIAQIHGYCLASGLLFALGCDLLYVAEDARIGATSSRSTGLPPDLVRWPWLFGIRRAKEMLFTGDVFTGREAADMGIVNSAHPAGELEEYVEWMARRIALLDNDLLGIYKRAINDASEVSGFRPSVALGSAYQALVHWVPKRQAFWERVKEYGPKAAFSARDEAYGGATPRSLLWQSRPRG